MKRILVLGLCILGLACTPRDQDEGDPTPSPTETSPPTETPGTGTMDDYNNDRGSEELGTAPGGMNGMAGTELPPFHVLDANNDGFLDQTELANLDPAMRNELDNIPRDDEGRITQEEYEKHRIAH